MPSLRERVLANFISQFVAESQNINSIMLFTTFLLVAKKTEQISVEMNRQIGGNRGVGGEISRRLEGGDRRV